MTRTEFTTIRDRLAARPPARIADPRAAEAAVAVLLVPTPDGDLDLLLIKRAERRGDPWSGQMALPGGRRHAEDLDLEMTAGRETREETGIDLASAATLGELDDLGPQSPVLPPVVVRPFVFGLPARPVVWTNEEVEFHLWTPLRTLRASAGRTQVPIRGTIRGMPAYLLGPHVVWGLTERILTRLLERLAASTR